MSSSSSASGVRRGIFVSPGSDESSPSSSGCVLDILYSISSFAKVLTVSEALEIIGTEIERAAFLDLKALFSAMQKNIPSEQINLEPFLEKLGAWNNVDYLCLEHLDVLEIWDAIVKLVMVVVPDLRSIFVGHTEAASEIPGWIHHMSRSFSARYTSQKSLEDLIAQTYAESVQIQEQYAASDSSSKRGINGAGSSTSSDDRGMDSLEAAAMLCRGRACVNALVLKRSPDVFAVSIDSPFVVSSADTACSPDDDGEPIASVEKVRVLATRDPGPVSITFPATLDLSAYASPHSTRIFDLIAVVTAKAGTVDAPDSAAMSSYYFRAPPTGPGDDSSKDEWFAGGEGVPLGVLTKVSQAKVLNCVYDSTKPPLLSPSGTQTYPRFIVYCRRGAGHSLLLPQPQPLLSKAQQMRLLGDISFSLAICLEHYEEAHRLYDESISLDDALHPVLSVQIATLEKFERTQRAKTLEEQADLALANRRFREASECYKQAIRSCLVGSVIHARLREKDESVSRAVALDAAAQLVERGEAALCGGNFAQARESFSQAFKLSSDITVISTILQVRALCIIYKLAYFIQPIIHAAFT